MGEDVRSHLARHPERLGVARGGYPDGQFSLNWAREDAHGDGPAIVAREFHRLTAPEPPYGADLADHHLFGVRKVCRLEDEVVRLPTRGERNAGTSPREVIDHRPLLRHANGGVQWEDATAGADLDVLRDGGDCGARYGWIREQPSEGVKVPFGRPDRFKAVAVSEFRGLQEQIVGASIGFAFASGEEEETKRQGLNPVERGRTRHQALGASCVERHREPACQCP